MKKSFLTLTASLLVVISFSQITLEHTYPVQSWTTGFGGNNHTPYFAGMVYLSQGAKYAFTDTSNHVILYNSDHSLFKTLTNPVLGGSQYAIDVFSITDHLMNTDDNLEYIALSENSSGQFHFLRILSEAGTVLLSVDTAQIVYKIGSYYSPGQSPYIKSDNGYKLFVENNYDDGTSYGNARSYNVYSFTGSLPLAVHDNPNDNTKMLLANPYPNPAAHQITLPYQLPTGTEKAELEIYNMNGQKLKTLSIGNAFNTIQLNVSDFSAGTYFYYINTTSGKSEAKKFVVQ